MSVLTYDAVVTTKKSIEELTSVITCHEIDFRQNHLSEDQKSIYQRIRNHRLKYYIEKAPHLTQQKELDSECEVDSRSIVYAIEVKGEILLSIRLTPRPFEIENFQIHNVNFEVYNSYAELGRLVSDPELDQISTALLARYLLCYTGLHATEKYKIQGFVAICRPFRISYFRKFGLIDQFSFFYNERKMTYHFLTASMEQILSHTSFLQVNEQYLIKRLRKRFHI